MMSHIYPATSSYSHLTTFDKGMDKLPFFSDVNNFVDLIVKRSLSKKDPEELIKSRSFDYITHIQEKSVFRCVTLMIPIMGQILVFMYDKVQQFKGYVALKKGLVKEQKKSNTDFNIDEVIKHYKKAISLGNKTAVGKMFELVSKYENAIINRDPNFAEDDTLFEGYLAAAKGGHPKAMSRVAKMYAKGTLKLEKDPQEAFRWHHLAAIGGHVDSMYELAQMFRKGIPVTKKDAPIVQSYNPQKSPSPFDIEMFGEMEFENPQLGSFLSEQTVAGKAKTKKGQPGAIASKPINSQQKQKKSVTAEDFFNAFRWYKMASEAVDKEKTKKIANPQPVHANAMYQLAKMYKDGLGTTVDNSLSKKWMAKAAENGNKKAEKVIKDQTHKIADAQKIATKNLIAPSSVIGNNDL